MNSSALAVSPTPATERGSPAAFLALLFVQVCFATFPVAGKIAFRDFEPLTVATWRVLVAGGFFGALALSLHPRRFFVPGRDLALLFWLSLLGVTLNQVLFIQGLSLSTATNAGLLMAFIPPATHGFALLLRKERFRPLRALGVAVAALGIALLFLARGADLGGDTWKGDLMMVANASVYALYLVQAKPLLARTPPLVAIAWVFIFGAFCVPILSWRQDWIPAGVDAAGWAALAWVVVVPTVLGYLLNLWALERIDATIVGIFVCLQPLVSIALAVGVLGESPDPVLLITGPLVVLGVVLVSRRRPARERRDPPGPGSNGDRSAGTPR